MWHAYVGHYYQYPIPWILDWKRQTAREVSYALSRVERAVTRRIGYLAPNLAIVVSPELKNAG